MILSGKTAHDRNRELVRMLAIGGSDSCGGAGIQADIKTGAALGVEVTTAITAVTAQNSLGVQQLGPVPEDLLRAQIVSVVTDIRPHAVKLGMLFDAARVNIVGEALCEFRLAPVVCDPVLASTSGRALLDDAGKEAIKSLLPLVALLTPNANEAAALTGRKVSNADQYLDAGRALLDLGARAVLLKGGHMDGDNSSDALLDGNDRPPTWYSRPRIRTRNDHGTGCVLASAITAELAKGHALSDAVTNAREFVQQALVRSAVLWHGAGHGGMDLVDSVDSHQARSR